MIRTQNVLDSVYQGWPKAVVEMQRLAQIDPADVVEHAEYIAPYLPLQHLVFHTRNISFLPVATKDRDGRVWASILAGESGEPGFISTNGDPRWLHIRAKTWAGDPIARSLGGFGPGEEANALVGGVGVELWSRRRNKLGGVAKRVVWDGDWLDIDLRVTEAMGNCPKYITVRHLESHAGTNPTIAAQDMSMPETAALPAAVIDFIKSRDQVFLATSYVPHGPDDPTQPHLGCNIRGGRAGFVRVRADGRTLVLPDFSGNRHMTSLGNMRTDPSAGLAFPCFVTGDVLYLTGRGRTVVGAEAKAVMPRARPVLSMFEVTGFVLVRDALPFRQSPSAAFEPSPYNPPIRYLVEEQEYTSQENLSAKLVSVEFHGGDRWSDRSEVGLATFTFEAGVPIQVQAGMYVVIDTTPLIGQPIYRHMSADNEKIPNDDGVRTWTISRLPTAERPTTFSITIRNVKRGRVTPRLFSFAAYWDAKTRGSASPPGSRSSAPELEFPLLGVGGTFLLPPSPAPLLLVSGGIGITPFLAFLRAIAGGAAAGDAVWDVALVAATREPAETAKLIAEAAEGGSSEGSLRLRVLLMTSSSATAVSSSAVAIPNASSVEVARGRLSEQHLAGITDLRSRKVYLCGPPAFETAALGALGKAGIKEVDVTRESFAF
ncbi:hypothetical protein DFJ73DRAFT_658936 [Zopfochytrium polystomum]|nr:hypothetical protein DFJ73DRAFT_658936 [Zopfochytrium polystomum]